MPVKIRLMRIGAKKHPFYRVVAVDERSKRNGQYLELLGTYNPLTEPKEIKLDQVKIDAWIKKGAQPSNGYLRMIGKAPQRPPRKPKKEKKEKAPAAPEPPKADEAVKTEEAAKSEETKSTNDSGEGITTSADQPLSEPGEADQNAQAMTSVTSDEPVAEGQASLAGENGNTEDTTAKAADEPAQEPEVKPEKETK